MSLRRSCVWKIQRVWLISPAICPCDGTNHSLKLLWRGWWKYFSCWAIIPKPFFSVLCVPQKRQCSKSFIHPLFRWEQSFVAIVYFMYFGKHWNKVWNLQLKMSGWRKVYSSDLFCIEYRNTCIASLLQRTRQKAFLQFFTKSTKNKFKKLLKYVILVRSCNIVLFHIF